MLALVMIIPGYVAWPEPNIPAPDDIAGALLLGPGVAARHSIPEMPGVAPLAPNNWLLELPNELLLQILEASSLVDQLCLKRSCSRLWRIVDATPQDLSRQSQHRDFSRRIRKDAYPALIREERRWWWFRCCSYCYDYHSCTRFALKRGILGPETRRCEGADTYMRVCLHKVYSNEELMVAIKDARLALAGASNIVLFDCQRVNRSRECKASVDVRSHRDGRRLQVHIEDEIPLHHIQDKAMLRKSKSTAYLCPHLHPQDVKILELPGKALDKSSRWAGGRIRGASGWRTSSSTYCKISRCCAKVEFKCERMLLGGIEMSLGTERVMDLDQDGNFPPVWDSGWYTLCEGDDERL